MFTGNIALHAVGHRVYRCPDLFNHIAEANIFPGRSINNHIFSKAVMSPDTLSWIIIELVFQSPSSISRLGRLFPSV